MYEDAKDTKVSVPGMSSEYYCAGALVKATVAISAIAGLALSTAY